MSSDVLDQVIMFIKASSCRVILQMDESTDVGNMSQLIIFVRFVKAGLLVDEFLCCRSLPLRTRAVDIFEVVDAFFQHHSISWNKVGSLCTDGAPAMLGHRSGFTALVKKRAPHVTTYNCILHRHAIATRTLPIVLKAVLDAAVKAVNFIRGSSLNHRIFKAFCDEMCTEHQVLLFHTEVQWLSRGRGLTRVSELHGEIVTFLRDQQSTVAKDLAEKFEDSDFLLNLAYLPDIFGHMNELNVSMQGTGLNKLAADANVEAFKNKVCL